jgi:shikimate dehydrogenase
LHRAAYQALGLTHTYQAIEIAEAQLPEFVLSRDADWLGFSLTMPLKEVAFQVADVVDQTAAQTGSINTLVLGEQVHAFNTDVQGIVDSLNEFGVVGPRTAVILGAGATARSALVALAKLGVTDIRVVARNATKVTSLQAIADDLAINFSHVSLIESGWLTADVVVNTTPANAMDEIAAEVTSPTGTLLDVVYNPWPSLLAASWGVQGGRILSGLSMLLHQAAHQVTLMTGQVGPVEPMRAALNQELLDRGLATI